MVSGADYYPSGALTGFDYGNGQSFTQLLNERLQPASLTSVKSGGETALDLSYQYNARGLITHQTDGVDPTNSREYLYTRNVRNRSSETIAVKRRRGKPSGGLMVNPRTSREIGT